MLCSWTWTFVNCCAVAMRRKKRRFHRQNGGAWGEGWWLKISWIIDSSLKYMVSSGGIKPLDTFKCLDWLLRILRKDTCHFTCIGLTLYGGQVCSNGLPYRTDVFITTFVHRPAMVFSLRSALISSLAGFASGDCFVRLSEPLKERVDIMISFFSHSKVSQVIRVWICINKIRDINRKGIKKLPWNTASTIPENWPSHGFSHWTMELMDSLGTRAVPGCACSSSSAAKHHTVDHWNPATPVM